MKANQQITFSVDGKAVSQEQIVAVEKQRYEKVLGELVQKGVLYPQQTAGLNLEQMRVLLAETKEQIGRERMLELYHDELLLGDRMWHEIADHSPAKTELQSAFVDVYAKNISIYQFLLTNRRLMRKNNLYFPSMIHPEHYYFYAYKGQQIIVETFGQYKYPAYLRLIPATDGYRPVALDADTTFAMTGYTHLMHDGSDTKLIGMHQFKDKGDDLVVRLGVFLPKAAPREMLEGHRWHLMVEFNNCLRFAAEQRVCLLQQLLLKQLLRKLCPEPPNSQDNAIE